MSTLPPVNGKVAYSVTTVIANAPSPEENKKPAKVAVSKPAVTASSPKVDSQA